VTKYIERGTLFDVVTAEAGLRHDPSSAKKDSNGEGTDQKRG
jgi:hypothetical protein